MATTVEEGADTGLLLAGQFYYRETDPEQLVTRQAHGAEAAGRCRFLVIWRGPESQRSARRNRCVSVTIGRDEPIYNALHAFWWVNDQHTDNTDGNVRLYTWEGRAIEVSETVQDVLDRGGGEDDTIVVRNAERERGQGCVKVMYPGGAWEMIYTYRRGQQIRDVVSWSGCSVRTHEVLGVDGETILDPEMRIETNIERPITIVRRSDDGGDYRVPTSVSLEGKCMMQGTLEVRTKREERKKMDVRVKITMGPYGDPACGIDRPMGPRGARGARDSEAFETADGAPWGAWGPRVLGGEGPGGHGCCEGLAWGSGGWVGNGTVLRQGWNSVGTVMQQGTVLG